MTRYEQVIFDLCKEIDELRESKQNKTEINYNLRQQLEESEKQFQKYIHEHPAKEVNV
jgi:hypothetical protein